MLPFFLPVEMITGLLFLVGFGFQFFAGHHRPGLARHVEGGWA